VVLIDGEATGAKLAQWLFWLQFYFDVRTTTTTTAAALIALLILSMRYAL